MSSDTFKEKGTVETWPSPIMIICLDCGFEYEGVTVDVCPKCGSKEVYARRTCFLHYPNDKGHDPFYEIELRKSRLKPDVCLRKMVSCTCKNCQKPFMEYEDKPVACPHCQSLDYTVIERFTKGA